jgi:uncharacterized C2H2 Zn-finger protein
MKDRIKRAVDEARTDSIIIRCPVCDEAFHVHRDTSVEYLSHWWAQDYPGKSYRQPTQEVMRLVKHPHDASEFVDAATGDPWLGEFFRGVEREYLADTPDLSEQALESR